MSIGEQGPRWSDTEVPLEELARRKGVRPIQSVDELAEPGLYERQRALGSRLMRGLESAAAGAGVQVRVQGLGTVFQVWFADRPITNYRQAVAHARHGDFRRWWQEMMRRGVMFHPSQDENMFLSMVHTDQDVDRTLAAAGDAFAVLAGRP